jgi:hypothetical protein
VGLSQAEILARHTELALKGHDLDAMIFSLKLGEPSLPEAGGTGFQVGKDPAAGASAYAHEMMTEYLANQAKLPPSRR